MNIEWVGISAYAVKDGVRYKVAYKADKDVVLTVDGKHLFPDGLANMSASVVSSPEPKKPSRKGKVDEVPELDDLDI